MKASGFFPSLEETKERPNVDAEADIARSARQGMVEVSTAITRFEGGQPSAYCSEQLIRFVNGEISAEEMRDRVVAHWSR